MKTADLAEIQALNAELVEILRKYKNPTVIACAVANVMALWALAHDTKDPTSAQAYRRETLENFLNLTRDVFEKQYDQVRPPVTKQ